MTFLTFSRTLKATCCLQCSMQVNRKICLFLLHNGGLHTQYIQPLLLKWVWKHSHLPQRTCWKASIPLPVQVGKLPYLFQFKLENFRAYSSSSWKASIPVLVLVGKLPYLFQFKLENFHTCSSSSWKTSMPTPVQVGKLPYLFQF